MKKNIAFIITTSLYIGVLCGGITWLVVSSRETHCNDFGKLNNLKVKVVNGVCYAGIKNMYIPINNIHGDN